MNYNIAHFITRNFKQYLTNKMGESKDIDCLICLEKVPYKKICSCPFCEYKACNNCTKISILYQTSDPSCPSCNHSWNMEFCHENFGKSWMIKDYRNHKKQLLFDIEKSKIPNTMPTVERIIKTEKCKIELDDKKKKMKEIEQLWRIARDDLSQSERKYEDLKNNVVSKSVKDTYDYKCPKENCQGFLSNKFICPMCDSHVCKKCFEIKKKVTVSGESKSNKEFTYEHKCDKNNIETFNLIKKDTKPCPNCSTRISKISGCDQMWCTQCHVTFSWTTGLKVNGNIHNPHYYEWKRNNAETTDLRNVGEVLCGGIPDVGVLSSLERTSHNMHWLTIQSDINNTPRILYFKEFNYKGFNASIIAHKQFTNEPDGYQDFTYIPIFSPKNISIFKNNTPYYSQDEYNNITSSIPTECKIKKNVYISMTKQRYFISNLLKLHRAISHFSNYELHYLRIAVRDIDEKDESMRIKYIMEKINEKRYKTLIMKKNNRKQKLIKILHVFEMCNVTILETFNNIIRSIIEISNEYKNHSKILFNESTTPDFREEYHENTYMTWFKQVIDVKRKNIIDNYHRINKIINYCNKELWKISKLFNQNVPFIHYGVNFTKNYKGEILFNRPGYLQTLSIRWDNHIFQLYKIVNKEKKNTRKKVTGEIQDKHFNNCWLFNNYDNYEYFEKTKMNTSTIRTTDYVYKFIIGINDLFEENDLVFSDEEKFNKIKTTRSIIREYGRGSSLFN